MPKKMASGTQTIFYWQGNTTPPADHDKWARMVKATLCHLADRYGEDRAYIEFRKIAPYYFKGVPNSKDMRISLQTASSVEELYQIIDGIL
jgi:tRNA-dihydrouridine synthase